MFPPLATGCLNVSRFVPAVLGRRIAAVRSTTAAVWAWIVPTLVLIYKILLYRAPTSVLVGSSMSAFEYFFDIQRVMPTWTNLLASDPVRLLAQMTVTAPFYAGIAYSIGPISFKYNVLPNIFPPKKSQDSTHYPTQSTPASPLPSPVSKN